MSINNIDFIDFSKVDKLLEGFNKTTGFLTAILDTEGNVLSKSGWRQICTEFHRVNPETAKKCRISDTVLANKMAEGKDFHYYQCLNGLVDVAVPIVIKGQHIANLFSGQFFFERPDISFFRRQAKKYGFDEEKYIEAVREVPVVSKEEVKVAMNFLLDVTQLISEVSFQKLEQTELNKALKESEERFRALHNASFGGITIHDKGVILDCNQGLSDMTGYSIEELIGMDGLLLIAPESRDLVMNNILCGYEEPYEAIGLRKNNETFPIRLEARNVPYKGKMVRTVEFRDISERKKAEKELLHFHDLMKYIIEHDRSAVAVHDRDLNYIYVSQRYLEQYKVSDSDIIGKHHYEVFPDLPQKWRDVHQKALKGEISSADEDVYNKEDGTLVYTRWECRPWYEADGSIGGIVIYTEVINERIERELEIKQLNDRLEILVQSVKVLSSAQSVGQVQDIVVKSARKLIGADGATVVFKENDQCFYAVEDAISPLWAGKRFSMNTCVSGWVMQHKQALVIEDIYTDSRVPIEAYGSTFVKSLAMVPINLNEPLGAIGNYWKNKYSPTEIEINLLQTLADSAARALENIGLLNELELKISELAKNEIIKTKMVANIGDVIVIIDRNNINQYKSPNIETLFGWKPEELIGKSTWDIIHPDDVAYGQQFLDKLAIEDGATGTIELRYKRKDGKYVWIEVTVANLLKDKVIQGFLGNYHDISGRKKSQQELIEAKERAEESDRLKSAFLSNMSHEIRTPLNSIMGFASLLPEEDMKEVMTQYANIIYRNTEQLVSIIDGIVLYSKLQAKQMICNNATFELNSYLLSSFSSFNHVDYHENVEFKLKIDMTREIMVKTDQEKLKQVITGLLSNAYKFTQKGEISLAYAIKNNFIEFIVKDTGIGIPENEIAHVFERFFRASNINESTTRGTGIGLSIAQEMAELLGGKIWVESEPGKGSAFYFTVNSREAE